MKLAVRLSKIIISTAASICPEPGFTLFGNLFNGTGKELENGKSLLRYRTSRARHRDEVLLERLTGKCAGRVVVYLLFMNPFSLFSLFDAYR